MDVLNNRYKIIERLYLNTKDISSFLAEDLWDHKSRTFNLKIIEASIIETDCLNLLKENFLFIKQLKSPFHFQNYEFSKLFSVDGNRVVDDSFIYTHEYIKDEIPLSDYLKTASAESILQIIVLLCKALNYISIYGLGYKIIKLADIFIINTGQDMAIKLKDFVTSIFEHSLAILPQDNSNIRNFEYNNDTIKNIIISILAGEEVLNITEDYFEKLQNHYENKSLDTKDKNIINCIFKICRQLIQNQSDRGVYLLYEIIKDINKTLNMNFSIETGKFLNNHETNRILKIEEREIEKKEVLSNFYKLQTAKSANNIFFVQGQSGIGKTEFLSELYFLFLLEKCNVYTIPDLSGFNDESFVLHILRNLFLNTLAKNNILFERGMQESFEFFTQQKENKDALFVEKIKYKFINTTANLLRKGMLDSFNVFIVDDIHVASDFMLDIFFSLIADCENQKKVIFIFSYNQLNIMQNKYAEKFVSVLKEQNNTEIIQLYNFSESNISYLIKNILEVKYIPEVLTKKIYSYTNGNPAFSVKTIHSLIASGAIKKDLDSGLCVLSGDILNPSIPLQPFLAKDVSIDNLLNNFDKEKISFLNMLAVFQDGFTIHNISAISEMEIAYIQSCVSYFLEKNILKEYSSPLSLMYTFTDKVFHNTLYEKLDYSYKMKIHKKIIQEIKQSSGIFPSEIIWHAEKADELDVAIKYCIKNEAKIKKQQTADVYTFIFEKLYLFVPENYVSKRMHILLLLAQSYYELKKISLCKDKLEAAQCLMESHTVNKKYITELYIIKTDLQMLTKASNDDIKKTLKMAEMKVDNLNDFYIETKMLFTKIKFLEYQNKIRAAVAEAEKLITLCGSNKKILDIKIEVALKLGNYLYNLKLYHEAKQAYGNAAILAGRHDNSKIKNSAFNNLALIYLKHEHNYTKAAEYYTQIIYTKDELEDMPIKILAMLSFAALNVFRGDYHEAYDICDQAIRKIKQHHVYGRLTFAYVLMYEITVYLGKYDQAFIYKDLAEKQLKKNKNSIHKGYQVAFYHTSAWLCVCFGDYAGELKYLNKMLNIISDSEYSAYKPFVLFRLELNKLASFKIDSTIELTKLYTELMKRKHAKIISPIFQDILICIWLIIKKRHDLDFTEILKDLRTKDISKFSKGIKTYLLILKSYINIKNTQSALLEANASIIPDTSPELNIDIKIRLGLSCFIKQEIYAAIVYFMDAQNIIKQLLNIIPEKLRLRFFNINDYALPFIITSDYIAKKLKQDYLLNGNKITNAKMLSFLNTKIETILSIDDVFIKGVATDILSKTKFKNKKTIDIIRNFSSDFMKNIRVLLEFAAVNLLATSFDVFIVNMDNTMESLFNFNKNDEIKKIYQTINDFGYNWFSLMERRGCASSLVIPLHYTSNIQIKEYITGYLVFISDNIINNFGECGKVFYNRIKHIFAFLVESFKMRREASIDRLTSVLTRKYIETAFDDLVNISKANNKPFSILMYDLDHFKKVNDIFGHQSGDAVLKATADVVLKALNRKQLAGRLGGEEFIILLPNTDINEASDFAEKIRKRIEALSFENPDIKITVSIGAASFPQHGLTRQALLSVVDQALYKAKNSGRNQVFVWQENLESAVRSTNKLEGVLTGDIIKDTKKVFNFIRLISLIRRNIPKTKRLDICMEKILDIIGAEKGFFIPVKNGRGNLMRPFFTSELIKSAGFVFNKKLIKEVLTEKSGLYKIDWDNIAKKNEVTGVPSWDSVLITPIIKKERIVSLIYLSIAMKKKEFSVEDLNLLNFLAECIAPFF